MYCPRVIIILNLENFLKIFLDLELTPGGKLIASERYAEKAMVSKVVDKSGMMGKEASLKKSINRLKY